ncbi:MAG TPA: SdpI family protein [Candidatus Kapabacteria bacterium]|nr:SdpI family protein [Candidatus Kapabacteria bacterium]
MEPNNLTYPTRSWWREWPVVLALLAPFVTLAIVWPSLPARVPMHFDANGNVNRYGSPLELLVLPGISVLVSIVLYFIPRLDPKKANIMASMPAYRWIRFELAVFFTYIFALMLATMFQPNFDATPLIAFGVLSLFFGIGFMMPKLKQNYMIGIRLPWTLESEDNWNRTHAFAGRLWPWGAVVGMILVALFPSISLFIAVSVLIALLLWTGVYSYRMFHEEKKLG